MVVPECAATEEQWAASTITALGFDEQSATHALEVCDFSFSNALVFLLYGQDKERWKYHGINGFRRLTNRRVYYVDQKKAAADSVRAEYEARAQADLQVQVRAIDLGQYAGKTTAACFWLSLAAGLSRTDWHLYAQALPGLENVAELHREVHALPVEELDLRTFDGNIRDSPLGLLAERLRRYMCAGSSAVLLRRDMIDKLFPAFGAIDAHSHRRQLSHYKDWVAKLAMKEYADELVAVAVAFELRIRIVCVPFTPRGTTRPWAITTYESPDCALPPDQRILLGNNDAHYMWLSEGAALS
jgi:hypothetical protein